MNELTKQNAPQEEIKSHGNNSIKPSRFKAASEETPKFDEQSGKFSNNIRKPSLIPDSNKPDLYR